MLKRLVPIQPVKHLPASIAFYRKLGFEVVERNDAWGWAMLRCGSCELMLDQSINQPADAPRTAVVYLYPEDLIGFHRHARAQGLDVPPIDVTFYGMTEFRIDDPDGNRLWIGHAD